jgi:hypothetical protein
MSFNRALLPDPVSYFQSHGHTLFKKATKGFRTDCTIHGGKSPNLSVHRETGAFFCFSCGAKGGNVLDYEMQATGCDFVTAARALGAWENDGKPTSYKPSPVSARTMLEVLAYEVQIVALMAADLAKGITISGLDKDRLFEAAGRINRIAEELHHA